MVWLVEGRIVVKKLWGIFLHRRLKNMYHIIERLTILELIIRKFIMARSVDLDSVLYLLYRGVRKGAIVYGPRTRIDL